MVHDIQSAADFTALLNDTTYVIVDFYATWCPPCKQIAPTYSFLASKHTAERHLQFAKVDIEKVQEIATKYRVTSMPTFVFFKESRQVAVNGNVVLKGADVRGLIGAVEKLSDLARARVEADQAKVAAEEQREAGTEQTRRAP